MSKKTTVLLAALLYFPGKVNFARLQQVIISTEKISISSQPWQNGKLRITTAKAIPLQRYLVMSNLLKHTILSSLGLIAIKSDGVHLPQILWDSEKS